MAIQVCLTFDRLNGGVLLDVDDNFLAAIPAVFSGWNFKLSEEVSTDVFASVSLGNGKYSVSSPFMDKPEGFSDPVNALCRLVVETAWAQLRERQDMLCLHCAASLINGRLVVFPSTRRAGKSTFSLGLMAAGLQIFTDDFLPLVVDPQHRVCGFAQGISPRLRLPLPPQIGPRTSTYIDRQAYLENRQYRYVVPGKDDAAGFGEQAPIGALVFLDRNPNGPPELSEMTRSDALKILIKQNFSRAMNASAILNVLAEIAENTPSYRLSYCDVDPAVDLVAGKFSDWTGEPVKVANHDFHPAPVENQAGASVQLHCHPMLQSKGVTDRTIDDQRFLSASGEREIIHLNQSAAGIWQLLAEPVTFTEILEVLSAAFPEQPRDLLRAGVEQTLKCFQGAGLIERSGVPARSEKPAIENTPDNAYPDDRKQNTHRHGQ